MIYKLLNNVNVIFLIYYFTILIYTTWNFDKKNTLILLFSKDALIWSKVIGFYFVTQDFYFK